MKRHRKIVVTLITALLMVFFVPILASAATANSGVNTGTDKRTIASAANDSTSETVSPFTHFFPTTKQMFGSNKGIIKGLTAYRDNYHLDLKDGGFFKNFGNNAANSVANFLFSLQAALTFALLVFLYYAFQISMFTIFSPLISPITKQLKAGIYNELQVMFITLIGIYFVIKLIRNQKTQIWAALGEMIIVMVLATLFFNHPVKILKGLDGFSNSISATVLAGTYGAKDLGKEPNAASIAISNSVWNMFVHKPWQIMEFGDTKIAKKYQAKILTLEPDSDARQDIINDIADDGKHFQPSWGPQRAVMAFLYLALFVVMAAALVVLIGLIYCYQILAIITSMFGIFVFVLALVPWFGSRPVWNWLGKLIGYISMKIVVSFLIALSFTFMLSLYDLSDKYSVFVIMVFQIAVMITVFKNRKELLGILLQVTTATGKAIRDPASAHKMIRDNSLEKKIGNRAIRHNKGFDSDSDDANGNRGNDPGKNGNMNNQRNTYNGSGNSNPGSGRSTNFNTEENAHKSVYSEGYEENKDSNSSIYSLRGDLDPVALKNDLKRLNKIAEEILEQKYDESKKKSEEESDKLHNDPKYSYFVQSAMNNEAMGRDKFEQRQRLAVANQIQGIIDNGGSIEDIRSHFETNRNPSENKEIIRPRKIEADGNNASLQGSGAEEKINDRQAATEYTQDFNQEFKKQYQPQFMEKLINKYGQENVKVLLQEMKKNNQLEEISNPAGYLTQSLRNNADNGEITMRSHESAEEHISIRNERRESGNMGGTENKSIYEATTESRMRNEVMESDTNLQNDHNDSPEKMRSDDVSVESENRANVRSRQRNNTEDKPTQESMRNKPTD